MSATRPEVVGRDEQLGALVRFLDASETLPGAVLLEGDAGIGKTTLWRRGVELASARSYRVLSCRPSESEAQLSFTALGDLLEETLEDVLPRLPRPQARALAVALLLEDDGGPPPDQRAIALALLGAVRVLAQAGPLAVAVDDIQWIDRPSAFVLEFALRRLHEEPVAFLFALRAGQEQTPLGLDRTLALEGRLRRLVIGPLSLGALHRLLTDRLGLVLSRPKLRRLHELSGGNPFFALELARAFESGSIGLEPGEPLPGSLAALVHDRLVALPVGSRAALLAASALSQPTLDLVARAVGGDAERRLAAALEAHVVELEEERIRFSHPLFASAVYAAVGLPERRELHRRLAEIVPDPEERARHLALGAEGPDATVAASLEAAARHAHSRGALAAAAELSERARLLTPVDREEERHRRTLHAATYAFEAGESGRSRALLEDALASATAGAPRARALTWLGDLEIYEGDRRAAANFFRRGLVEAGGDLSVRSHAEAGLADALFLSRANLRAAADHARTAVAVAERIGDESKQIEGLAIQGMIAALLGRTEWRALLERGIELEREVEPVRLAAGASFALATVLVWVDDLNEARTIFRSLRARADERAEESALPWTLAELGLVEFFVGDWVGASRCANEAAEISLQTGQEPQRLFALGVRALVRACRGETDGARADAKAVLDAGEDRGVMIATILASSALGLLELSLDRPEATDRILGPLGERLEKGGVLEPGSVRFTADEIEALIDLGRLEEAKALLDRLERRARKLDRPSALAGASRCRGLLAATRGDLEGALAALERALAEHERVPIPFERARTLLALGSARRRVKRRRAAREALAAALAIFEELGAQPWAEKTRAELARIGGRAPVSGDLTPSERRVATLVAKGRSNKEVAATLFVSVKTVEANLSRIYTKLGVRSRTEMARHLAPNKAGQPATKV